MSAESGARLAIIVPCHNDSTAIRETIDSPAARSGPGLAVDDGSTDRVTLESRRRPPPGSGCRASSATATDLARRQGSLDALERLGRSRAERGLAQ
jgi:hypothetical protein